MAHSHGHNLARHWSGHGGWGGEPGEPHTDGTGTPWAPDPAPLAMAKPRPGQAMCKIGAWAMNHPKIIH